MKRAELEAIERARSAELMKRRNAYGAFLRLADILVPVFRDWEEKEVAGRIELGDAMQATARMAGYLIACAASNVVANASAYDQREMIIEGVVEEAEQFARVFFDRVMDGTAEVVIDGVDEIDLEAILKRWGKS